MEVDGAGGVDESPRGEGAEARELLRRREVQWDVEGGEEGFVLFAGRGGGEGFGLETGAVGEEDDALDDAFVGRLAEIVVELVEGAVGACGALVSSPCGR